MSLAFLGLVLSCQAQLPEDHPPQPLRDAKGRIARSESAKNRFKRANHCPANGRDRGPCPGYVIDHVLPLACGGKDDPSNMQWQTVPEGKAKDRWELTLPGCPAKFSKWQRFKRAVRRGDKP